MLGGDNKNTQIQIHISILINKAIIFLGIIY